MAFTDGVSPAMRAKLEPAEVFHEILEHRWYMAEKAKHDIPIEDAAADYVEKVLPAKPDESAVVGVDTQVVHGFVNCNATGAITGIGNAIPREVLHFVALAQKAATGDVDARVRARELGEALEVLSTWDEGTDLVLYYKHMMVMQGHPEYTLHFNETDELSPTQRAWAETQFNQFRAWYAEWCKLPGAAPGDYA